MFMSKDMLNPCQTLITCYFKIACFHEPLQGFLFILRSLCRPVKTSIRLEQHRCLVFSSGHWSLVLITVNS